MYNLIIGADDGVLPAERLLEGVESDPDTFVRPGGDLNLARLLSLPTLLMPETGDTRSPQVAQVGNVVSLNRLGRDYHFRFIRDESSRRFRPTASKRQRFSSASGGSGSPEPTGRSRPPICIRR